MLVVQRAQTLLEHVAALSRQVLGSSGPANALFARLRLSGEVAKLTGGRVLAKLHIVLVSVLLGQVPLLGGQFRLGAS